MIRGVFISFLNFLLFSNLFIACCAMAQGALTYLLIGAPINLIVISLLGSSTLFLYNFSLFLSKPKNFAVSPYKRVQWFFLHDKLITSISAISFFLVLLLAIQLSMNALVLFFCIGLFAVSYNFPVLKVGGHRFGLRSIPGAKLFVIAGVWACSCVLLPIIELKSDSFAVSRMDTFLLFSKRFLFILAITLPFDIRDIYQDRTFRLQTIPVLIGERNALRLCQFLLIVYLLLLFFFAQNIDYKIWALVFTVFLTSFFIFSSKIKKSEYYYFFILDGTLVLQFLTVWMANKLS